MWYVGHLDIAHLAADPQLSIAGENPLKIKKILDVHKVGWRFKYLAELLDKPISETSWFLLSDIPDLYDETLEKFHQWHPKLPQPSKYLDRCNSKTTGEVNVLVPPPTELPLPMQSNTYTSPTQMTMCFGRVS